MPTLDLTGDELRDAAMAARLAAAQAERDAKAQTNPRFTSGITETAARYAALAMRFESARGALGRRR